jgi:hypothetical protein
MSAPPTTLSAAVHECRIRVARDDIYAALGPVSRHSEAARLSLELDDYAGLEHHLHHVIDCVRLAARRHRDLRAHLLSRVTVTSIPLPPDTVLAYRINDAAKVAGLSRSSLYVLIGEGKLLSVLVAGRRCAIFSVARPNR